MTTNPHDPYKALELDCGDNSCMFGGGGKGGQRTNGGCRCLENLPGDKQRFVKRLYTEHKKQTKALELAREALKKLDSPYVGAIDRLTARKAINQINQVLGEGRCPLTGNICGTDTWAANDPPDCKCGNEARTLKVLGDKEGK